MSQSVCPACGSQTEDGRFCSRGACPMRASASQGRRVPDDEWFSWQADGQIQPGDYGKIIDDGDATWFVCAPDGARFMLASPHSPDSAGRWHEVEEHEDGTITVEPKPNNSNSILSPKGWHGWIYGGAWR